MNIQAYKAVIWSQLTRSTGDFPVNSICALDICQINSCEIQQRTNVPGDNDSWQTQLRRRFECNLQSMATCTQQLHLYCRLLQENDYCFFLTDDPGDFADKGIFYIVDCHNVTLLLKSAAGFKLRFIRFWFIFWFRRHLLGQIPLPLVDISASSCHGREEVEVLEVAHLQTAPSVCWP